MFNFLKTQNVETLSEIKNTNLRMKITKQIISAQKHQRGSYSQMEFLCKDEWFVIRKEGKVVVAVGIEFFRKVQTKQTRKRIYLVSDFVNIKNDEFSRAGRIDSNELSELFNTVVAYAKKSPKIDYLVCAVPKLNARPLTRANFNAKLFNKEAFIDSGLIDALRDQIIISNQDNPNKQFSKSDILSELRSAEHLRKSLFSGDCTPNSLLREIRVIQENKKFIESTKPEDAYYGLILGLNTRK